MKKIFLSIQIFLICILIPSLILADDYLEEVDEEYSIEEIVETDSINNVPKIYSRGVLVLERKSGRVLYEKNGYERRPMASTTKIMTAIVVLENAENLNQVIEISKKAANIGGSQLGLKSGEKATILNLLYGLMLKSGNDAAIALAEAVGGDVQGFSKMMNEKAKELGLQDTNFVTPHGLDSEEHYTTPYELAILTDYALKNNKFKEIVGTNSATIEINREYKINKYNK